MKKLRQPNLEPLALFDSCIDEMGDPTEANHYKKFRPEMSAANIDLENADKSKEWYKLPRAKRGKPNQLIVGDLTKGELKNLYETKLIKSKEKARRAYDEIKVAANGHCPYCGGLGQVYTLDHYLPKSYYPSYSVTPLNLVPACRDCNTGTGAAFFDNAGEQPIHPYIDDDLFFDEKWIFAEVQRTDPIHVKFLVRCPDHWPEVDVARASQHFSFFNLARRYSVVAAEELSLIISQRRGVLASLNSEQYKIHLSDGANAQGLAINGWRRALYAALSETIWFLETDFNSIKRHM